jgi:microcystin-dependent protein
MPGYPVPWIKFREDDQNGFPLAGGKLYSFAAGTSTPLATYTTAALAVMNANPTILDTSGRADIFIPDGVGYKFVLHDALGNVIWGGIDVEVPKVAAPVPPVVVPPGTIVAFAGTTVPAGWLLCDGASVSTTLPAGYPDLFAAILYTYGGSGGTFSVPDLRQRFPLGKAASGTGVVLGSTGGAIDHTHAVPRAGWVPSSVLASGFIGYVLTTAGGSATVDVPTGDNTSGTANPPFIALHFIIKT